MPLSRPRLVFMGTPELARTVLARLADDARWQVSLVVAQPDKPVGRGLELRPPPVKLEALARGLPVCQPDRARDHQFLAQLRDLAPDAIVVAAYGQLLPPPLLAIPPHGCLNIHTSLLPRWRGAAPIQWALLSGDPETGVTLMRMDAGLDTGDIVASIKTPIGSEDTGETLHDRLADLGASLLVQSLPDWLAGHLHPVPQPSVGVTHARKLTREDGCLDWSQPSVALWRRIRAFNPWPGAFTSVLGPAGQSWLLKIWEATPVEGTGAPGDILRASGGDLVVATGSGALRITTLQREGRRRLSAREFLTSGALAVGSRLGAGTPPVANPTT